ncbi:hypothetical protein BOX15_Mlig006109g2 [Macrostomum lignano]|uniref:Sec1 family domain-containing protein 2 n=1 Tax=Macrostomum lignano TaxID=282301 RepID=A0A267GHW1_9PLAT|nr:hypothetical protein BOX15_Mlig006109g2 [Macrostomum lignano]
MSHVTAAGGVGGASASQSEEAVLSSVRSAVIYADSGAADWINWRRLLPRLIEHGALAVREFQPAEKLQQQPAAAAVRKAVFLLAGRPDSRVAMETLAELVSDTGLNYVILLTGACPETAVLMDVEEHLAGWLGHGATAQVRFVPLGHVTLIRPPEDHRLPEFVVLGGGGDDVTDPDDDDVISEPIGHLAGRLHSLLAELSLKEDILCLGPAASRLGDALAALGPAKERRRLPNHRRATVVLVDRALDLVGPLSFLADSWLDTLCRSGRPLLVSDVHLDLTAFTRSRSAAHLPIGCLSGCLDSPLGRRLAGGDAKLAAGKAAAAAAQRALADAMTAERVAFDPALLVASTSAAGSPAGSLGLLLDRLASERPGLAFSSRHSGTVQLAVAVAQSLAAAASERRQLQQQLAAAVRIEKSMLGAAGSPPDELAEVRAAAAAEAQAAGLPADALLALKVIGSSLLPAPKADVDAESEETAAILGRLSRVRAGQPRLRLVDNSVVPTYAPLVAQLGAEIVGAAGARAPAPQSAPSLQLEHKSTGMAGLFGYLGVSGKPKLAESELVLVCVIGGATWAEHRALRERLRQLQPGRSVALVTDRLLRAATS